MTDRDVELLAIGAGPSNLGLAVALEELAPVSLAGNSLLIEKDRVTAWQRGMLLPWAQSQVSFLKDLVSLRNPRSRFTFLNYLHTMGRLDDFVNLATFTPYRVEISDYLRWVAESLTNVRVEYGRRCVRVVPKFDPGNGLAGWRTELADGTSITSRVLVIGIGREAHVPPVLSELPADRVVHSTQYLSRIQAMSNGSGAGRPERVVVIGGAQSSAEMLASVVRDLPDCRPTVVMRRAGFVNYQTSKFTNELYYPSFVDEFYHATPEARAQMMREMHGTNYSGLAPGLLEDLYRQIYLERLCGRRRISIRTMTDVTGARLDGGEVVLTVRDRNTAETDDIATDLVLLGTGLDRRMPALVRRLAADLGLPAVTVNRQYRLVLDQPSAALCYLQGVNEETHGIADSLLSVVAPRSAEIAEDIMSHRALRARTRSAAAALAGG